MNSPIKTTPQEGNDELVYLSRTRKGTMRSKMVIDKINDMKIKLGSKMTLRKASKKPWTWYRVMTGCLALTECLLT